MLSLGPLRYALRPEALPASMQPFYDEDTAPDARTVDVRPPSERTPDATATTRAAFARRDDRDLVFAASALDLMDALCALCALDAPSHDCVLLHAAAVSTARGIALLTAPPGVGKSSAARHAAARAFAYNSVMVRSDGLCWPMPFAGGDGDPVRFDPAPRTAGVLAEIARAELPSVEWLTRARATVALTRACVRPGGYDPAGGLRAQRIFTLAERLIPLRLGVTDDPRYLAALDAALKEDSPCR